MPPKYDWVTPKAKIRKTLFKGKGLFAGEPIRKGEEVIIWGGTFVNLEEANKAKKENKLIIQFDDNLFSIEDRGESDAYFINHSCSPNVWMKNAFTLETMSDIQKGEELTADYVLWEANEQKVSKWECRCGSENCRHLITGKDWKILELQKKYKNHFSPLINKKIEKSK